jgi:hypothetical protein
LVKLENEEEKEEEPAAEKVAEEVRRENQAWAEAAALTTPPATTTTTTTSGAPKDGKKRREGNYFRGRIVKSISVFHLGLARFFHKRSRRWKALFVIFVFVASLLTLVLAGNVPTQNIDVVNGQNYRAQTYAESPNATIGYKDNFTTWTLSSASPNATAHVVESPTGLTLTGTFPATSKAMSVTIQNKFFSNLIKYPLVYTYINVTTGVQYGIRFFSTASNGTVFPIWKDTDSLNHKPGLGQFQNIQVNIPLLALSNSYPNVSNVTKVQFYVERASESYPTNFTMTIQTFEFLNFNLVPYEPNQTYHSVYFTFNSLPNVSSKNWVLNKIDLGMSLVGSQGATYTLLQLNGTASISGYNYQYSPAVQTYEYTLYPRNPVQAFPDSLPPDPTNSSAGQTNYAIVLVALSGTLSNVTLNSVSFVYTPAVAPPPNTPSDGPYWYLYLIIFIFLLPLTIGILLYEEFRKSNLKPSHLFIALGVGLACRFALAPVASQPFDLGVYATSARGWFEYASTSTSLGPTLPFTFLLYWLPYSFYGALLKLGFHDFFFLNQQIGFVEMIFLKAFPIMADVAIFFLFQRFKDPSEKNFNKIFAIFYFLNPLSIYVSSVWGQYEASTVALIVLGFLYLSRQTPKMENEPFGYLKSSLAFVVSALIEVVGLIPLTFLFIKSLLTKPFNYKRPLLTLAPIGLIFVYPPEFHLMDLIYLSAVGLSTTLSLSQPHTTYTIISNFPQILPYHPLVISLAIILLVFVLRRDYGLNSVILFTFLAFTTFLFFAAQEPQWWVMILVTGLLVAMISQKYSLGIYMLAFGALVAFLIFTYTQGSGYMLFGTARDNLFPLLEDAAHGINLYTVGTTAAGILALGYALLQPKQTFGTRTIYRSSLILVGVFMLSFFWFSIMGVPL